MTDDAPIMTFTVNLRDLRDPAFAETEVSNAVYALGVHLFEHGGEHNRTEDGAPVWRGNGHHAAQALAEAAVALWRKGAKP